MIREKEEEKKKRHAIVKTVSIIAGTLAVLILTGYILITKVFTLEKLNITGNVLYSSEKLEEMLLSDENSWSTLYVYGKYRFFNKGKLPFIDELELSVSLSRPHEIDLVVYEKGILGYLYIPSIDENAYFDRDGFVVETSREVFDGIPKVEGFSCEEVVLYEKLDIEDESGLKNLLSLTQLLKKYEISSSKISYDEVARTMVVTSGKIVIKVGTSDNLSQKILRLQYILPQIKGKKGTLHLENWTSETTDIVFDPS